MEKVSMDSRSLRKVIDRWNIKTIEEYREFRCGICGKKVRKAWHVWHEDDDYKTPVHLCRRCFKQ